MDTSIENTVGLPSRGTFRTYIFLATFHLANKTDIEILTIRVARNESFPLDNEEELRNCIQFIVDVISGEGRFVPAPPQTEFILTSQ